MVNKTVKLNGALATIKKQKSAPIRSTLRTYGIKEEKVKREINEKPSTCNVSRTLEELGFNKCPIEFVDKAQNTMDNDYKIIQELQEQNSLFSLELEDSKLKIRSLLDQLLDEKEKHEKEVQNSAARVKELENIENSFKSQNDALYLKLDSSTKIITKLRREVDDKSKMITAQSSELHTINSLKEVSEANDSIKSKQIEQLHKEKKKYKLDFIQASRERDEAAEETIILKNKLDKLSETYSKLKAEFDEQKNNRVINLLESSDKEDEITEKNEKIRQLEEIISKHEDLKKHMTRENNDKENTILNLEEIIIDLKSELLSWETRAGCFINSLVRDNYVIKIENLEKEIQQLKIKNKQLLDRCSKSNAQKCEKMEELKGVIKRRQELINEQDEVIKLMRYVNQHQATGDGNEQIKDMIKEVFLKYDDISRQIQQSEELTKENRQLRTLLNECRTTTTFLN